MVDALLTALSIENHHPSTLLSMDSSALSIHNELDHETNCQIVLTHPPDINLSLAERSPPPQPWNPEQCNILDVGLSTQIYEPTTTFLSVPKVGRKSTKRIDSIWGAWFFFSFYFKPVLNEKSKAKMISNGSGDSGFDKSDLQLDIFMVQHDMENMYMWVFKERPENALGKMQLRSYMNGHSRQGERPFPFSPNKGFMRSHRMQRKHYRGLSNPQCVHGVEVVPSPRQTGLNQDDRKRWMELTGRELNFTIPPEASDYAIWRNLPSTEFELQRPPPPVKANHSNGDVAGLSPIGNKRKKDFFLPQRNDNDSYRIPDTEVHHPNGPHWLNGISGVLRNVCGPVTGAKTTYEDEEGYLILISLPFVDRQRVKVSWKNTLTHGIIKVSCMSTSRTPFIKRHNRTFKLADASSEHCPMGEFVREIPLSTRIPEDAKIEAYYDGSRTVLEILLRSSGRGLKNMKSVFVFVLTMGSTILCRPKCCTR